MSLIIFNLLAFVLCNMNCVNNRDGEILNRSNYGSELNKENVVIDRTVSGRNYIV